MDSVLELEQGISFIDNCSWHIIQTNKILPRAFNCMSMISFSGLQVRLAANSCVTKDLAESGDYGGFPAVRMVFYSSFSSFISSSWILKQMFIRCRSLSMSGADSLPNCADYARTVRDQIAPTIVPLNVFQLDL